MYKIFSTALAMVFITGSLFQLQAQELPMGQQPAEPIEVSDEELEEFVDVAVGTLQIQQEAEMQYPQVIEDAGLTIQLFQEISQAEQMGASRDDIDATETELDAFDSAMEDILEIQEETQERVIAHVEAEDMELDRYEEIAMALQHDQELMQKVQEMLMQSQGMQQQAPPQNH